MTLPRDPIMLLSVINTKLRDQYPTLDALCEDMDVPRTLLEQALGEVGFAYDVRTNRFA